MRLEDLDDVVALRNYRKKLLALRPVAESGFFHVQIGLDPMIRDLSSHMSLESVREFVVGRIDSKIREYEMELARLGVEVENSEH